MTVETNVYQSKPMQVEAVQLTEENFEDVAEWCKGEHYVSGGGVPFLDVPTIHGPAPAGVNDWVVRGPNDFYPCDPDTFSQRWERVSG